MDSMNTDNENMFLSWLSSNVSPAQLSELYLSLNEIEQQAKKSKLITSSLYENFDLPTVKKICADVERNKSFKLNHKRSWSRILSALDYLQKFSAQNQTKSCAKQSSSATSEKCIDAGDGIPKKVEDLAAPTQNETVDSNSINVADIAVSDRMDIEKAIDTVHFDSLNSMAFSQPISLSYFEDVKAESSWEELYIDACILLLEDYPDIFMQLRTESIEGIGNTWLVDYAHIDLLAMPAQLTEDFFVETEWSTFDLLSNLRWILDRCLVDYENVVITYSPNSENKKVQEKEAQLAQTEQKKTRRYRRADKEAFYRWLIDDQKMDESICKKYVSAIRAAERFAKERAFTPNKLFTDDPVEAKATADMLCANSEFIKFNTDRHNQLETAISMLLTYYSVSKNSGNDFTANVRQEPTPTDIVTEGVSVFDGEIDTVLTGEEFSPLREALAAQNITTMDGLKSLKLWPFMNQHNLYSIGTRQNIFAKVIEMLYPTAELSDQRACTLQVDNESYRGNTPAEAFRQFCEEMVRRNPIQMRLLIGMRMPSGKVPILKDDREGATLKLTNLSAYIREDMSENVAKSYTEWVRLRCGKKPSDITMDVPHDEMLQSKTLLKDRTVTEETASTIPGLESTTDMKKASMKRVSAYAQKLEALALAADMNGMSYDEAKDAMQATMVATKHAAVEAERVVDVRNRLYHEDAFIDWQYGADQLEAITDKLMQKNNGYISSSQLYEFAKVEMNMFLNDNDMNDERSVYDIACHLFEKKDYHGKHYSFYGKMHISRTEQPVTSNLDIFRNYAVDQGGFFSFDALVEYLHGIGVGSGNLRMQMRIPDEPFFFYYESGVLMYAGNMNINDAWITAVKKELALLLEDIGGHVVLRAVPDMWFERLPSLPNGKPWTPLLLQSVLRCYSEELGAKTIQALSGQSLDTLHAMLVAYDSPIQTFGDVVVSYLVDGDIKKRSFQAEELRMMLVEAGIIQGNELIWNMPKALNNDERFAWNASEDHVIVEI